MQAYPDDSLEETLRNVFDFDVYKPDTIKKLGDILNQHGYAFVTIRLSSFLVSSKDWP